ncbi:MAG: pyridoxamine 5'-phosphate oxidase family protein [Natronomonas sp.]
MSIGAITESGMNSMEDDGIRTFLTQQGVGVLGIQDDGVPYLVPLSFGFDGKSTLYFVFLLFGTESRKETLIDENRRARFLVHRADSMHEWQSVSCTGDISPVADEDWDELLETMENAWHSDLFSSARPMRGVEGYRFEIDDWSGIQYGIVSE